MKLSEIAALVGGEVEGDDAVEIVRVAKIEEAVEGDITFVANPKYEKFLSDTRASSVIVARGLKPPPEIRLSLLRVEDPYVSFLKVLQEFQSSDPALPSGIHPTAVIASTAQVGSDVSIGAYAVISEHCRIGDGTTIGHAVVLRPDVTVGAGSLLYHHVTVREGCRIGSRVIIHSGTVIGSDGFGFAPKSDGTFEKIPQLGIVVIEDDVEIGACCTVDRATMGETRINKGAKLDNLIQVAHNVVIGENTVIAAQTGISGSTKLGANNMIGGQVGITGHLDIADRTKIGAQSGIHKSITKPGGTYFGYPALPHREAFRIQWAVTQLPELLVTIREMKETILRLEEEIRALQQRK